MKQISNQLFPLTIGAYTCVTTHSNHMSIKESNFARYKNNNGQLAFAKLLRYSNKPWENHWKTNELLIYPRLNTIEFNKNVSVPHLISSEKTAHGNILLLEYINGKTLREAKRYSAVRVMDNALGFMNAIHSSGVMYSNDIHIPKRHNVYFLMAFPIILVISYIKHKSVRRDVHNSILFCIRNISNILFDRDYAFIHRDLNDTNVLVRGNHIWLIDFQTSLIADRRFELANIVINLKDTHRWSDSFYKQPNVQAILDNKSSYQVYIFFCLFAAFYEIGRKAKTIDPWLLSFLRDALSNTSIQSKSNKI